MKLFICADMEGATGITHREQLLPEGKGEFERGRKLLTGDVNAAIEAAIVAGVMNLPFSKDLHFLEKWLEPSLFGNKHKLSLGGGDLWVLAIIPIVVGAIGIAAAVAVYLQKRYPAEKVERPILARGWRHDEAVSDFMGGPGRKGLDLVAWFYRTIVDGAVYGTGRLVRSVGGEMRSLQTGLVRSYAALVAVGAVGLIAWFLVRTTF